MVSFRARRDRDGPGPKLTFMDARMLRRGFLRTDIRVCLPHGPAREGSPGETKRVSLRVA